MRIITRTVLILSVVSLLADIASEMLYPVIPVYLQEIGFSVLMIGTLEGVVNFTAGVSKGFFGKWSDEKGLRLPFVRLGYLLSSLSKPMMALFTHPGWVFGVRSMDRLGKGLRTAARDALLSGEATPATKARVFGFHRAMDTVGAALGPVFALVFLYFYPTQYKNLFYLAFIPGVLSVLFLLLLREKKKPVSTLGKGSFFSYFRYWRTAPADFRKIVPALLLFALFNSSDIFLLLATRNAIGSQTLVIAGTEWQADSLTIGAYVFYNLVYALFSFPLGILADKMGFKKVILAGMALFAVVYGGFAMRPSLIVIFILFGLYGIYAAATEGVIKAWITNLAHERNTATAIGFYTSCESCSALLASILAGATWTRFGSSVTFASTAVISLVVLIYLSLSLRNK